MAPCVGIMAILTAANIVGGSTGWQSFIGLLPDETKAVAAISGAGRQPELVVGVNYPTVQILMKGAVDDYAAAYAKMEDIFNALHRIPQNPAAYTELVSCVARGAIQPLGYDDKRRPMFSLNFNLITTPVNPGYRL